LGERVERVEIHAVLKEGVVVGFGYWGSGTDPLHPLPQYNRTKELERMSAAKEPHAWGEPAASGEPAA
ncbi:MAG TPA: hypothetical protein VH643_15465, partial [Gemmataceae bacterium]